MAAVPILTTPFVEVMDRVLAYWETDHPMPKVILPHPIQNLGPDELDARARQLADAAEAYLPPLP